MLKSVAYGLVSLVAAGSIAAATHANAAGGYPPYGNPYGGSIKDAPPPAPVAYIPPPNWAGVYIGAHLGYGWAETDWNFRNISNFNNAIGDRAGHDPSGWFGGGQLGVNIQSGRIVWGLEGTLSGADLTDHSSSPALATDRLATEIDMLWTITGRLGYDWGGLLTYVKAGYAGASVDISARDPITPIRLGNDDTLHGWTVGFGAEYLFSPNVIVGLEYSYADLGSASYRGLDSNATAYDIKNDVTLHTVMARISYKFDANRYLAGPSW